MNGLGQALAMLASRSKADKDAGQGGQSPDAYGAIYAHIQGWFASEHCPLKRVINKSGGADYWLLKEVIHASQADYLLIQAEAGLYVEWLKKFAIAFLTEPEKGQQP
jgi:CRISPR-associated protein Cmr5